MDKLEEPKPADHIQCARKAIVVSWETFSERHKVKAEGIPASTKSWNFPSCWNGGFKHCLPHVKCLLSSSACTSGICPPKSGGVLGKNQFCIISLNRRVPKALWGQVCFVCCLVLGFIYFFFLTTVCFSCQQGGKRLFHLGTVQPALLFLCWLPFLASCCCCCW